MTNKEWLLSLSENELAEVMVDISERVCEKYCPERWDACNEDCVSGVKSWLKAEREDSDEEVWEKMVQKLEKNSGLTPSNAKSNKAESNGESNSESNKGCSECGACKADGGRYIVDVNESKVRVPNFGDEIFYVTMDDDTGDFIIDGKLWHDSEVEIYLLARGRLFDSWHKAKDYLHECQALASRAMKEAGLE